MTNIVNSQKRLLWLDNLKAINIFFVVFVHAGGVKSFITPLILSFFMPLFFFISGLFAKDSIKEQSFKYFLKQRISRLWIPYFYFSIISYINWLILYYFLDKWKDIPPLQPLLGIFYGVSFWLPPSNIALWFLPCLIITEILFFLLIRLPSRKSFIAALFLLSVVGYVVLYFITKTPYRLPWNADLALIAIVFYGIGYLSKSYIFNDTFIKWHRWLVVIASLMGYITFTFINSPVSFFAGALGNYFYFFLAALSGILFWTHIARMIKTYPLITAIGQNTLVIFALHLLFFQFLTPFFTFVLKIPKSFITESDIGIIIYTIVAMIMLLKISQLINKYTPWLLGKKVILAPIKEP